MIIVAIVIIIKFNLQYKFIITVITIKTTATIVPTFFQEADKNLSVSLKSPKIDFSCSHQ